MALRNYWITTEVDGRSTVDATGPRSKDGGFETTIEMRSDGGGFTAVRVAGFADEQGRLTLRVGVPATTPDEVVVEVSESESSIEVRSIR